jgi:hypothetical protein
MLGFKRLRPVFRCTSRRLETLSGRSGALRSRSWVPFERLYRWRGAKRLLTAASARGAILRRILGFSRPRADSCVNTKVRGNGYHAICPGTRAPRAWFHWPCTRRCGRRWRAAAIGELPHGLTGSAQDRFSQRLDFARLSTSVIGFSAPSPKLFAGFFRHSARLRGVSTGHRGAQPPTSPAPAREAAIGTAEPSFRRRQREMRHGGVERGENRLIASCPPF